MRSARTRKVGFVFYQGFTPLHLAVAGTFDMANQHAGEKLYDVRMLSHAGGAVAGPFGLSLHTEPFGDARFDLLVVGGAAMSPEPAVLDFLREAAQTDSRIASVCTGAFALAAAGLLDGRKATTHWKRAAELQARYPMIDVDADRIFIEDGPIWTCAGSTAGLDLALALIEDDFGIEVARAVARFLVMYHRRTGGQSQFSTLLELEPKSDRLQAVVTYARRNLSNRLNVEELAEVANLSARQFTRLFQSETGLPPAKAVEKIRLEAARNLMVDSTHPIEVIARQTGFGDSDRMRRAFVRAFGRPPQSFRRDAGLA